MCSYKISAILNVVPVYVRVLEVCFCIFFLKIKHPLYSQIRISNQFKKKIEVY